MKMVKDNFAISVSLLAVLIFLACAPLFVSADVPTGSIVIYGINGTVTTGSRNVWLNLSYNASHAIDSCRWANDAAVNLNTRPWEPCTTVKAWILSEGYGEKYVYYQVRDKNADTATFNDAITYAYTQDYTAPTPPTVYDGFAGDDIDWWNDNTTLYAHWFNATEDISTIYYMYRILNNSVCSGTCDFTDVSTDTQVTLNGLTLVEGRNFSFEVVAYNPFDMNSTLITSDGARIDITKPSAPIINSSTHPDQSRPYDVTTATFNFSASDALSGLLGYSYMLDNHPGTSPDGIVESRAWQSLAELHNTGYNQTLKVNSTGSAYAVFSQLHHNLTQNDSVRVKVALAEPISDYRDLMGVKIYLVKVAEGAPIASFNMESGAVSSIANMSLDIKYVQFMYDAKVYQFGLTANTTVDDNTEDIYVVVSGLPSDDNNRHNLEIAGTKVLGLVDNTTKNYVCDEANNCHQNTTTLDYAIGVERLDSGTSWTASYDYLSDGTYYFHAKAKDNAGNWGDTSHYKIIVAAGGVNSLVYSPYDGEFVVTNQSAVNVTVKVSVASNASVYVVAVHPDGSNYTSPSHVFNSTYSFGDITLEEGQDEIYAVTNNTFGVQARSPSVYVTVSETPQPPMNKTLRATYAGCAAWTLPRICNNAAQSPIFVGIGTEDGTVSAPSVQADTSMNSLKIYMTRSFNLQPVALDLDQNRFMDRTIPMFGYVYTASSYLIRNELRYDNIHLGGELFLPPGTYKVYLRKNGITPDGKFNITISIE